MYIWWGTYIDTVSNSYISKIKKADTSGQDGGVGKHPHTTTSHNHFKPTTKIQNNHHSEP